MDRVMRGHTQREPVVLARHPAQSLPTKAGRGCGDFRKRWMTSFALNKRFAPSPARGTLCADMVLATPGI
jgi:hypothetical protein